MHACQSSRSGCVQMGMEGYLASLFTFWNQELWAGELASLLSLLNTLLMASQVRRQKIYELLRL